MAKHRLYNPDYKYKNYKILWTKLCKIMVKTPAVKSFYSSISSTISVPRRYYLLVCAVNSMKQASTFITWHQSAWVKYVAWLHQQGGGNCPGDSISQSPAKVFQSYPPPVLLHCWNTRRRSFMRLCALQCNWLLKVHTPQIAIMQINQDIWGGQFCVYPATF